MINKNQICFLWLMFFAYTCTYPKNLYKNQEVIDDQEYNLINNHEDSGQDNLSKKSFNIQKIVIIAASVTAVFGLSYYFLEKEQEQNKQFSSLRPISNNNDNLSQKEVAESLNFYNFQQDFNEYIDSYINIIKYKPVIAYFKTYDGTQVLSQFFAHRLYKNHYLYLKSRILVSNDNQMEKWKIKLNEKVFQPILNFGSNIYYQNQNQNTNTDNSKTAEQKFFSSFNKEINDFLKKFAKENGGNNSYPRYKTYPSSKSYKPSSSYQKSSYSNTGNKSQGKSSNSQYFHPTQGNIKSSLSQKNSLSLNDLFKNQKGYLIPKILFTIQRINNQSSVILYIFEKDQIIQNQLITPEDQWQNKAKIVLQFDIKNHKSDLKQTTFSFKALENNKIIEEIKEKKIRMANLIIHPDQSNPWSADGKIKVFRGDIFKFLNPAIQEMLN